MNVNLHIERIVLDGVSVPRHQHPLLQTSIEAELTSLLAAGGVAPHLGAGAAYPAVPAETIALNGQNDPAALGQQIARSVYGGIGR